MGLIQEIENRLLEALKRLFSPIVTPITRLWNILKGMFSAIVEVIPETIDLVRLIYSEVLEWKSFKAHSSFHFKSGVINLQSVRDRVTQLVDEVLTAWHGLVDLFTGGFRRVAAKPFEDAEAAAAELEELFAGFGKLGLRDFLARIGPKLEKAGGKLFEVLAIVQALAEEILQLVRDLRSIVDAAKDIRETFESGEGLFLKQTNPRKTVKLADGGSIKIRVGNLHS